MRRMLLSLRCAVATLLTASFGITFAPTASAVTQVDVLCDTGASRYICFVTHDATSPYGVTWRVNGTQVSNSSMAGLRTCTPHRSYTIEADVTDATGTITGSDGFICNPGVWP